MGVKFLTVHPSRGTVTVTAVVTGLTYGITRFGTPVSDHDVEELLAMVADPCCGPDIPFDGKVRLFGIAAGSKENMAQVTPEVLNAEPIQLAPFVLEEPVKKRKYTKRKRPVVVEIKKDVVVPVAVEPEKDDEVNPMFFAPEKLEDLSEDKED